MQIKSVFSPPVRSLGANMAALWTRCSKGSSGTKAAHPGRRPVIGSLAILVLALVGFSGTVFADPPTVNGLFYGDGDDAKYVHYATSYLGSRLYIYYDAPTATLYSALVVNTSVNDSVFGKPDGGKTYMASVGWGNGGGQQRGAHKLVEFRVCSSSPLRARREAPVNGPGIRDMRACPEAPGSPTCRARPGSGAAPPGYDSATSFAWNINTYEATPDPKPWNRDVQGTQLKDWVSPFDLSQSPPLALGLDGYPSLEGAEFSDQYQWEWRMIYEWSIPLGTNGANCGGNLVYVVTGLSHHSPLKEELGLPPEICGDPENDCFPDDITVVDPLSDYGDLPDDYGTTTAAGGPFHNIRVTGPYLGQEVVFELDGQPTIDASGDGTEEDGVTAVVNDNWTVGSSQTISVDVSNAPDGALLGAWFDWNEDGDFSEPGEFISWSVDEGTNALSVTVGTGFNWATSTLHARFRLFSSDAASSGRKPRADGCRWRGRRRRGRGLRMELRYSAGDAERVLERRTCGRRDHRQLADRLRDRQRRL